MNVLATYMTATTLIQTVQTSRDLTAVFATHDIIEMGKSAYLILVSVLSQEMILVTVGGEWGLMA